MKPTERLLQIFRQCSCENGFCDECPNSDGGIIDCDALCTEVSRIAQALMDDLTLACKNNNPCLVCGHFKPNLKEKCELMGWICEWEWRGAEHA